MRLKKWFKIGCIMLGIVSCGVFFSFMFIPLENLYNVCTNVSTFSRCDCITNVSIHLNQRSRNLLMNNLKDFPEEKCLMSIETKGRLGNLMGEYATLFALSRLNGRPAYIQEEMHKSLGKYFNISLPVLDKRLSKRIPWTVHVINDWMETKYSKFSGHFVKMDGYPCSWTFYHHIKDEVLREFTFHPPILDTVNKYLIEIFLIRRKYNMLNKKQIVPAIFISLLAALAFFYSYSNNQNFILYTVFSSNFSKTINNIKDGSCVAYDASKRCLCASNITTTPLNQTDLFSPLQLLPLKNVKCCMTVNSLGRLGNLMGEYATLFALSRLNQRPAFLLPEMEILLNDYFNLSIPVMDYRIKQTFPWLEYRLHDWMLPEYSRFKGYFVKLTGYPCSWTFFHHLRDEIFREFTFHSHIRKEVNEYLAHIKGNRSSVTFIGVHIRRGDYVELMKNSYNGVLADAQYLSEAMTYFRSRYNNCLFVVCSDDLSWAKKNINTSFGDVIFGWFGTSYTPGYDMALLSHCNHSIMTIGTFGFWSSYLAGGETVYLINFTRPGSKFLKFFHYETGLLPEWRGIPAKNLFPSTTEIIPTKKTVNSLTHAKKRTTRSKETNTRAKTSFHSINVKTTKAITLRNTKTDVEIIISTTKT